MRITEKYRKAAKIAQSLNLTTEDREELYQQLNNNSYFWNSEKKKWEKIKTVANPPTELIKIRIWADARITEAVASELIEALAKKGLRVMNCSKPYLCRPPEHLESRIYLEFVKNPEESNSPKNGDVVLGKKKNE
jgi:ribonuclease HII